MLTQSMTVLYTDFNPYFSHQSYLCWKVQNNPIIFICKYFIYFVNLVPIQCILITFNPLLGSLPPHYCPTSRPCPCSNLLSLISGSKCMWPIHWCTGNLPVETFPKEKWCFVYQQPSTGDSSSVGLGKAPEPPRLQAGMKIALFFFRPSTNN